MISFVISLWAGVASVLEYQQLLRAIKYFNGKPHDFNRREFVVGCTEAGDHVTSNQLRVAVSPVCLIAFRIPQGRC